MAAATKHPELVEAREAFRRRMEAGGAKEAWRNFSGRIAAVLSGGGARGAYEVGALLAFQDARLPTHLIAASSVGSVNAASFVAQSDGFVGNAEHLVDSWYDLTPPLVGIEWTRYIWVLVGLTAATAGFGNFIRYELARNGMRFQLAHPGLTWIALGLAGVAILESYDRLPYLSYVIRNAIRKTSWRPDRAKLVRSILANLIVLGFIFALCFSLGPIALASHLVSNYPKEMAMVIAGAALATAVLVFLRARLRHHTSSQAHRLLRLPLRSGLFANFERGRYLRQRISMQRLRNSPIRVAFTATDLTTGVARFFSSKPQEELARDPGVDRDFLSSEVAVPRDLMRAILASSALPIVYEPLPVDGRCYFDGAVVTNQPIRPAIRLGADVLFIIMMDSPSTADPEVKTFIDVGLRALDFLMAQNLLTDLRLLSQVNSVCEEASQEFGLRPEEVEIDFGARRYRYVRAFTIRPTVPLVGTSLDFDRETIWPAILRGYQDASVQIEAFLDYARNKPEFRHPRRHLRLSPKRTAAR